MTKLRRSRLIGFNRYYWAGEYCRDKDVVEAACGSGQGLGYLAGIARSLEAGDYSDEILSIARRHDSMIWDGCLKARMISFANGMDSFGIGMTKMGWIPI